MKGILLAVPIIIPAASTKPCLVTRHSLSPPNTWPEN